jgi:hypothetical protein
MSPVVAGVLGLLVSVAALGAPLYAQEEAASSVTVLEDFERYDIDTVPSTWWYVEPSGNRIAAPDALEDGEQFHVLQENENKFLRVKTVNESIRFSQTKEGSLSWNVREQPILRWRWRAHHLPRGANEREKNDTGGAIYVTFDTDWLGRPKSIKYTYSSSLPVGTVVDFGKLYVIVADSKPASGVGEWQTVQRNLLEDYDRIFGGRPPARPLSITIWSDSDTTEDWAQVDFDDIELLRTDAAK